MRTLAPPSSLAARPVEVFLAQWPLALEGDVEGIHQARVASRRLRELLPVLATERGKADVRRLRKAVRHLTRALGPSRELDVSRLLLDGFLVEVPAHADAVRATRRLVQSERDAAAAVLRDIGHRLDVESLMAHLLSVASALEPYDERRHAAALESARLERRAAALQKAVFAAGLVYSAGPLHGVRIALKKFRYAIEIAEGLGRFQLSGTLRRLKQLQDVLGDMHDLQVLAVHVRDAGAAAAPNRRARVGRLADHLDERIRSLHSQYTADRAVLVPVLARATAVRAALAALASAETEEAIRPSARRRRAT